MRVGQTPTLTDPPTAFGSVLMANRLGLIRARRRLGAVGALPLGSRGSVIVTAVAHPASHATAVAASVHQHHHQREADDDNQP